MKIKNWFIGLPAKASRLNGMRAGLLVYLSIGLFVLPLTKNLLRPGFYTSHDGEWMVIRLTAFHEALKSGQFPVRWVPRLNHGYGYPVTNFLYPLPFYAAEPFYLISRNPIIAVKIIFLLSIISAAYGSYFFFKKLGKLAAFVGSLIYLYSPYLVFNLYQRGSLGEVVAMGIIPWTFWSLSRKKLPVFSLLLAALIPSHNVVAALFFPLVCLYLLFLIAKTKQNKLLFTVHCSLFTALALGASAFFWLPALTEFKYVRASAINVSDFQNEYLTINQTVSRSGLITVILNAGLPLILLTKLSEPLWNFIKPLQIIQFPWRLLSIFTFSSSIISAKIAYIFLKKRLPFLAITLSIIFITMTFIYTKNYLQPASSSNHLPVYYQTNDDTTTVRAEYTPIWVRELPQKMPSTPAIHYYPGFKVFSGNQPLNILDPWNTNGVIVPIAVDNNFPIIIKWTETPLRTLSNIISAVSLLIWLQYYPFRHRRVSSSTID